MKQLKTWFFKLGYIVILCVFISFPFAITGFAQTEREIADSNTLFDWAEIEYPQFFSPPNAETQSVLGYLARYYEDTKTWLATMNGQIYVYGDVFNNIEPVGLSIKPIGEVSFYLSLIPADSSLLVINEIVAKAADGGSDWFELYVMGEEPIYLGDYSVVDDNEEREPVALPEITLAPGQFLIVYATDEEPKDTSYYVTFKLGSSDSVSLLKNGQLVDSLKWNDGDAPSGSSYGHLPDGKGEIQTLKPTPGVANETAENEIINPENAGNQDLEVFNHEQVIDVYIELAETDWQAILTDPMAEEYKPSTITYNGVTLENVAFRTKGNSSLMSVARDNTSNRYSFKVDMDYYVDGQTLSGVKKLNFQNNWSDPTYMREYISYELMRYLNVPTPRMAYANLYINGELHGLYGVVEQVDSAFLENNFAQTDGDLYKPSGQGSDLLWISDDFSDYSGVELKTNEDTSDNAAFMTMIDVLNHGTDYESVLNVDGILRYLAVSTALSNLDSYQGSMKQNYYLYEENGVFSIIPWDLNMSFGGFNAGCSEDEIIGFLIDEPTTSPLSERPLIDKLLQNADYRATYHSYFETLINGPLNPDTMAQTIHEIADLIRDFVYADPTAFYTPEQFEASLTEGIDSLTEPTEEQTLSPMDRGNTMDGGKMGLQSFVEKRVSNLRQQLDGTIPSSGDGSGSCGGISFGGPGGERPVGDFQDRPRPDDVVPGDFPPIPSEEVLSTIS